MFIDNYYQLEAVSLLQELIKEFHGLKLNLDQAIHMDDGELVNELDNESTQLWNNILLFKLNTNAESKMLLMFLVKQINELTDFSPRIEQITKQIVNLHDQKSLD